MTVRSSLTIALFSLVLGAAPVIAQPIGPRPGAPGRPAMDRLAAVVQRRLRLSNEQATRLQGVTRRFASEREQLMGQEREARRALRAQVAGGEYADQQAVGRQLDELLRLQQRRTQILVDEQRELATFLTPLQRAEFLGMQERAFRAAQQIRQQRQKAAAANRLPQP